MDRSICKSRMRVWGLSLLALLSVSGCAAPPAPAEPASVYSPLPLQKSDHPLVFVPGGKFQMGSVDHQLQEVLHPVMMNSFWIDRTEVTNAQYARCVEQDVCQTPRDFNSYTRPQYFGNPRYDVYPVIYVTWDDADTFCRWNGGRLPTEAEWEIAARGSDERIYPWGNVPPQPTLLNFDFSIGDTDSVGRYPAGASPYACAGYGRKCRGVGCGLVRSELLLL